MSPHTGASRTRLVAYAALARVAEVGSRLESPLREAIALVAAELSGCGWCLGRAQHEWLKLGCDTGSFPLSTRYRNDPSITPRGRAALALTEALACGPEAQLDHAHAAARECLTEKEVAEVIAIATAEHFFDPATGRLGKPEESRHD